MAVKNDAGENLGSVAEVLVDATSDIFVGLAIKPGLLKHRLLVPGEAVERLHDGTVFTALRREELHEYHSPEERHSQTEQAYAER